MKQEAAATYTYRPPSPAPLLPARFFFSHRLLKPGIEAQHLPLVLNMLLRADIVTVFIINNGIHPLNRVGPFLVPFTVFIFSLSSATSSHSPFYCCSVGEGKIDIHTHTLIEWLLDGVLLVTHALFKINVSGEKSKLTYFKTQVCVCVCVSKGFSIFGSTNENKMWMVICVVAPSMTHTHTHTYKSEKNVIRFINRLYGERALSK